MTLLASTRSGEPLAAKPHCAGLTTRRQSDRPRNCVEWRLLAADEPMHSTGTISTRRWNSLLNDILIWNPSRSSASSAFMRRLFSSGSVWWSMPQRNDSCRGVSSTANRQRARLDGGVNGLKRGKFYLFSYFVSHSFHLLPFFAIYWSHWLIPFIDSIYPGESTTLIGANDLIHSRVPSAVARLFRFEEKSVNSEIASAVFSGLRN